MVFKWKRYLKRAFMIEEQTEFYLILEKVLTGIKQAVANKYLSLS